MYVSVLQLPVLGMDLILYRLLDAEPQHFKDVISPPLCLLPVLLDQSCRFPDLLTVGLPDPVPPDSCLYKVLMAAPFCPDPVLWFKHTVPVCDEIDPFYDPDRKELPELMQIGTEHTSGHTKKFCKFIVKGAGTDPVEGAALAIAIIEALRQKGARIAATTHYAEIKLFALETDGVENGSCEFDVSSLRPTYRLSIGVPGKSNAFAISQRLGIHEEIVNRAKELVSYESAKFEDAVSQLEQTRQSLAKELEEAQVLRAQAQETKKEIAAYKANLDKEKEKEVEKARYEAKRIVERVRAESEKLLDELQAIRKEKDSEAFSQMASQAKTQMRSNLNRLYDLADPVAQKQQENYKLPRPLVKGDTVFITELGAAGTVLSLPDKNGMVQVRSGAIKLAVKESTLRLADTGAATPKSKSSARGSVSVNATKKAQRTSDAEVDLRGMNAEEGIMETDRFIDNAVMSGLHTLTLIHGKGTGILRNAIHQHLRRHKNVRTFRLGVYGEGESGVTIVELK